jgi:hypothetical protein
MKQNKHNPFNTNHQLLNRQILNLVESIENRYNKMIQDLSPELEQIMLYGLDGNTNRKLVCINKLSLFIDDLNQYGSL